MDEDFRQYYDLESYLLGTVRSRFMQQGYLAATDFFCIVIWKANRSKSKMAKKLLGPGYETLDAAVKDLTSGIARQTSAKDRLRYLIEERGFYLPTASAILSILYPDEFTIYDRRVCGQLGDYHKLANISSFENLWPKYQAFKRAVEESTPSALSLRDKDRYLWGKSFYEQLISDVENRFGISSSIPREKPAGDTAERH